MTYYNIEFTTRHTTAIQADSFDEAYKLFVEGNFVIEEELDNDIEIINIHKE